jgi:type IV secretion system protein TrbJ
MSNYLHAVCVCKGYRGLMGVAVALVTIGAATCSFADGLVVFDPLNYNQSILLTARSLQQINIQVMSLTKQTQMLINSIKNLASEPGNIAKQLKANVDEINRLMNEANGLTFKVSMTANQFQSSYPMHYPSGASLERLQQDADTRRNNTYEALNQTLLVQSQSVEALNGDGVSLAVVMGRSSAAIGALQAQQANNELLGLQVKQSMQTQALMAAQSRASALRDAEQQASGAEGVERFKQFIGNGQAYANGR